MSHQYHFTCLWLTDELMVNITESLKTTVWISRLKPAENYLKASPSRVGTVVFRSALHFNVRLCINVNENRCLLCVFNWTKLLHKLCFTASALARATNSLGDTLLSHTMFNNRAARAHRHQQRDFKQTVFATRKRKPGRHILLLLLFHEMHEQMSPEKNTATMTPTSCAWGTRGEIFSSASTPIRPKLFTIEKHKTPRIAHSNAFDWSSNNLPILEVASRTAAGHLRHHPPSVAPLCFLFFTSVQRLRVKTPGRQHEPLTGGDRVLG